MNNTCNILRYNKINDENITSCEDYGLQYKVLSNQKLPMGQSLITVLIEGNIPVRMSGFNIPIILPFNVTKNIIVTFPTNAKLNFSTMQYKWRIIKSSNSNIKIKVFIETLVEVIRKRRCAVPVLSYQNPVITKDFVVFNADRVYDHCFFDSESTLDYKYENLVGENYLYVTFSKQGKRIYTNEDEEKEYGNRGILPSDEFSFSTLYINGVIQPASNYIIKKRQLELLTTDIPLEESTIIISFVILKNKYNSIIKAKTQQYNFASDAKTRVFNIMNFYNKNSSFYNLFVNGVLQPRENYELLDGALILLSNDIPIKDTNITLETIGVINNCGNILNAEVYQYNAIANGKRIYTNIDEIKNYGNRGILNPDLCSYYNLFINGVIQPQSNYEVKKGMLIIKTGTLPLEKSIISLQFISVRNWSKA